MNHSAHDCIRTQGFEETLASLIAYAETQATLHQSLGDHIQFLFWARSWANLQRASDAIAFPVNDEESLSMWREHCEGYAGADVDFEFPERNV